jgi:hypothetical protein
MLVILRGPSQRAYAKGLIDQAPRDAVVVVRGPSRTLDQNAKMWAMLADISKAQPEARQHTPDVWKAVFMQACGHEVEFAPGLSGLPFPIGFRSSRLTKEQMSELIEFIYAYGAQHGVVWSDDVSEAAEAEA